MDRRAALPLAVGLLVVVAALYAHLAIVTANHPAPATSEESVSLPVVDHESAARLDRIEHALQRVSEDIAALRAERGRASAASAGSAPVAGVTLEGRPGEAKAAAADGAAGGASKDDSFAGVSDEDLRLQAKALAVDKKDLLGSIRRWEALAKRNGSRDARSEALVQVGLGYWTLSEFGAAEKGFREAIDVAGPDSDSGTEAGRMLGWTLLRKPDPRAAYEASQRVVRSPGAPPWRVANSRYVSALSLLELKDDAAARRELEGIVADYANSANDKWMVDDAKKRLETLK